MWYLLHLFLSQFGVCSKWPNFEGSPSSLSDSSAHSDVGRKEARNNKVDRLPWRPLSKLSHFGRWKSQTTFILPELWIFGVHFSQYLERVSNTGMFHYVRISSANRMARMRILPQFRLVMESGWLYISCFNFGRTGTFTPKDKETMCTPFPPYGRLQAVDFCGVNL